MSRYFSDFSGAMDEIDKRNIRSLFIAVDDFFQSKFDNFRPVYIDEIANEIDAYRLFSINDLISYLDYKNIEYTLDELKVCLNILLCEFSSIARHDLYSGKVLYEKLSERYQDTRFAKGFCDFYDDCKYDDKRFVLIADTHIGNYEVQSFDIINGIYNYCVDNNINNVFHLGDLLDGLKPNVLGNDRLEKFDEQIKIFLDNYPNINGIKTYSICGNHDEVIHGADGVSCILDIYGPTYRDLRALSRDKDNFIFYGHENFNIKFSDQDFRFGHRLYINPFERKKILHHVDEIDADIKEVSNDYSVCICGHLHSGVLFVDTDCYGRDKCFITVPSTSLLNVDGVVGFNIDLINSDGCLDKMIITELRCDDNKNIYDGESYEYKFREKNKALRKEFRIFTK